MMLVVMNPVINLMVLFRTLVNAPKIRILYDIDQRVPFGVMKLIVPVSTTRAEVENLVLIPGGMSGNIVD